MIRPSGTAHQRKTINQTQFLLFESYVIRVMTPTNAFAGSLQLSMTIKSYGPRQRTVWSARRGPLSQKARITLSRRTLPFYRRADPNRFLKFRFLFWGVVAGENAAPDIFNRPDPVPA